ncbi:TetR/AcrR family transcriptional regulator [Nocardia sp. NPDC003963]
MSQREEIVDVAERLLERDGPNGVTMRRVAEQLGIRAPSLYKHVSSKVDIETALQQRALQRLAAALEPAEDLPALAAPYRRWALEHPRLYEFAARTPLARERIAPGVEVAAAAPLLQMMNGDQVVARALWGIAHGLVDLELANRFPAHADLDAVWARGGCVPLVLNPPRPFLSARPGAGPHRGDIEDRAPRPRHGQEYCETLRPTDRSHRPSRPPPADERVGGSSISNTLR